MFLAQLCPRGLAHLEWCLLLSPQFSLSSSSSQFGGSTIRSLITTSLCLAAAIAQAKELAPGDSIKLDRLSCKPSEWRIYRQYPGEPMLPAAPCENPKSLICREFEAPRDWVVRHNLGSLGAVLEWRASDAEMGGAWMELYSLKTTTSFTSGVEVINVYTADPEKVILFHKGVCNPI